MLHIVTSLDALAAKQREVEAHEREAGAVDGHAP
jgi:hypothetical protein